MSANKSIVSVGVTVGLLLAGVGAAYGLEFNWSNSAGGNWSSTNNWSGGIIASGSGNTAVFSVTPGATITVDQDSDIGKLKFLAGSLFTLVGANTLGSSAVEVGQTNQPIMIMAPVVSGGWFFKEGVGAVVIPSLSGVSSGVQIRNGALITHSLSSGNALLGDWVTPANSILKFLLTTDGDSVANEVWLGGYGNNFTRILGGVNTNGTAQFHGVNAGDISADNEIFFTAEAGGQVDVDNITGSSASPLVKIGSGTLKLKYWGANEANRYFSGGTTVRNGTLLLGEDDIGTTSNGFVLANGRTSNGAGGPLGFSDFNRPVQLGDSSYEVVGAGDDIVGTFDGFHCIAGVLTNDGEIVTRLVYQQNTDPWAKAGLMMRESLTDNSKNVMMLLTPGNGATFQWRSSTGGDSLNTGWGGSAPAWLKLVRSGDSFSGSISSDGLNWSVVGSSTVSMGSVIQIGLAVSAHNNGLLSRAIFRQVSGLPAAWVSQDVGVGVLAGSGMFVGTQPTDDIKLLADDTRWVGHAINVNAFGKSVSIGGNAGTSTFAGPIVLNGMANLTSPQGGTTFFNGAISGVGGVAITGSGVVRFAGTNTYSGTTAISNGVLRIESAVSLSKNTPLMVTFGGDAGIYSTLSSDSTITKTGPGTLTVAAPQYYGGPTFVEGGVLKLGVPGLSEGRLVPASNTNGANPNSSIQLSTRYANSIDAAPWIDNSLYVYSGFINNSSSNSVVYAFAENFDDRVLLRIDGVTVLDNNVWDIQTAGSLVLTPGWHAFDLRVIQVSFGVGPSSAGNGVSGTGLGVAYSNETSSGWQAITDHTGNFLDSGAPVESFLSPSTTVSVARGAMLDLNRSTQTVAGVSGAGVIANGKLNVTGAIAPGGTNSIGTLTVQGDLSIGSNVLQSWDFNASSADQVVVSGTLTLPAVATLRLNSLSGRYAGQMVVLFTFGNYNGAMDLHGWSVNVGGTVVVDQVGKRVILLGSGTLLTIY